jgi:hypothetical protein
MVFSPYASNVAHFLCWIAGGSLIVQEDERSSGAITTFLALPVHGYQYSDESGKNVTGIPGGERDN